MGFSVLLWDRMQVSDSDDTCRNLSVCFVYEEYIFSKLQISLKKHLVLSTI